MKKLIIFLSLLGFLYGCMEKSSIVSPDNGTEDQLNSFEFLKLPAPKDVLSKKHFASKTITNALGGEITIKDEYITSTGKVIKIYANIVFPVGAFYGSPDQSYNITMQLDDETTSENFSPHLQFNNLPTYHVRYEGLDLNEINAGDIEFLYRADDGSTEYLEADPIEIEKATGTLEIKNVKIPHFSRYGFGT